jgi:hypothetical protein
MKFEKFWTIFINDLRKKKKFQTTIEFKEFNAKTRDNNSVTVIPNSSRKSKTVTKYQMQRAWKIAKELKVIEYRFVYSTYKNYGMRHSSYIASFVYYYIGRKSME